MIYAKPVEKMESRSEGLCKVWAACAESHCYVWHRARFRGLHPQPIWITAVHPRHRKTMNSWSEFIIDKGGMRALSQLMGSVTHWCWFVKAEIQVHPLTIGRDDQQSPACPSSSQTFTKAMKHVPFAHQHSLAQVHLLPPGFHLQLNPLKAQDYQGGCKCN